ncbi:MAG TPA: Xaa-Pro peptidase family protein [Clostridiales bacterium]|nr:Xaa-Pro peptidase family protein [Clostridiales bacterium]
MPHEIPVSEFRQRIINLQTNMQSEGYDLLLAYGNEAEPQFVRYLCDYWPSFETAGVLIPAQGDPLLLIGPESLTYASDRSKVEKIRLLKAFRESSEPEYPGKKLDTFSTVINECIKGGELKKFGVAGLSLMTVGTYFDLAETLKDYGNLEITKADSLITNLRMIKSENELACMREAANITRKTFDYVLNNIKPGMTENQVIGLALGKMHQLGADRESYPMWALTGKGSNQAISRARHSVIQSGDMMQIQVGARVGGYASSIGRPVVFGKATPEQHELIMAGYTAYKAVIDKLKANIPAYEVALHHEKTVKDIGYGDWLLYGPCHGNGLMEGEPPWIETNAKWLLQENMTFCVDIFLGSNITQTGLRIEDVVRITSSGVEQLTNYPCELFEL